MTTLDRLYDDLDAENARLRADLDVKATAYAGLTAHVEKLQAELDVARAERAAALAELARIANGGIAFKDSARPLPHVMLQHAQWGYNVAREIARLAIVRMPHAAQSPVCGRCQHRRAYHVYDCCCSCGHDECGWCGEWFEPLAVRDSPGERG